MSSQALASAQAQQAGSPTTSSSGSNPTAAGSPARGSHHSPTPSNGNNAANQKQVLTEEQKKANHIASEKKRRNNIREQYDKLAEMIPGMSGQGRSEGRVLEEAVKMATQLVHEREAMIAEVKATGGTVDPKLYDEIDKALKVIRDSSPRLREDRSDSQGTAPSYKPRPGRPKTNSYMPQVNPNSAGSAASQRSEPGGVNLFPTVRCCHESYPAPPIASCSAGGNGVDPLNALEPPPSLRHGRQALPLYDQHVDLSANLYSIHVHDSPKTHPKYGEPRPQSVGSQFGSYSHDDPPIDPALYTYSAAKHGPEAGDP